MHVLKSEDNFFDQFIYAYYGFSEIAVLKLKFIHDGDQLIDYAPVASYCCITVYCMHTVQYMVKI